MKREGARRNKSPKPVLHSSLRDSYKRVRKALCSLETIGTLGTPRILPTLRIGYSSQIDKVLRKGTRDASEEKTQPIHPRRLPPARQGPLP